MEKVEKLNKQDGELDNKLLAVNILLGERNPTWTSQNQIFGKHTCF